MSEVVDYREAVEYRLSLWKEACVKNDYTEEFNLDLQRRIETYDALLTGDQDNWEALDYKLHQDFPLGGSREDKIKFLVRFSSKGFPTIEAYSIQMEDYFVRKQIGDLISVREAVINYGVPEEEFASFVLRMHMNPDRFLQLFTIPVLADNRVLVDYGREGIVTTMTAFSQAKLKFGPNFVLAVFFKIII